VRHHVAVDAAGPADIIETAKAPLTPPKDHRRLAIHSVGVFDPDIAGGVNMLPPVPPPPPPCAG